MSWRWRSCVVLGGAGGGRVPFHLPHSHLSVCWSWGGPGGARPSWGEGLDLCPQRPRGKWRRCPGAGRLHVWSKMPLRLAPGARPVSWVYFSTFPASQLPASRALRCSVPVWMRESLPVRRFPICAWGPGQHGHLAAVRGKPAAGAAARAAGSCSSSSVGLGLGVQGLIREAGGATAPCVSRASDPCTVTPASGAKSGGLFPSPGPRSLPCYLGR